MPNKNLIEPTRLKVIEDLMNQNLSQAEVGRRLGLSRARIGQITRAHRLSKWAKGPSSLLNERQSRILGVHQGLWRGFPASAHRSRGRGRLRAQQYRRGQLQPFPIG